MKKNYFKKTLSLALTVLMLMSCWVFVAPTEAEARATINTYRKADQYGTPVWDGKDIYYSTWNSGSSYTKFTWPKHIYLDVEESLESAGYYYTVEWDYGNGTDYRIVNNGFIFGGWRMQNTSQWPASYNTMNNMFNNYDLDASTHGTQDGIDGESSTAFDLKIGGDNWDGAQVIIWRNPSNDNNAQHQYVFMMGTPKAVGTGRYSTSGAKPSSFGGWQHWSNGWKNASDKYTNSNDSGNWTTDCYEGTWKEVAFNITIYDKSTLNTRVTSANTIYNSNLAYSSYALDGTWSTFTTQRTNGSNLLKTRVTTNENITNQANLLKNAIEALKFGASNEDLRTAVANAQALQSKPGYNTLYTQASRDVLAAAIKNATESEYYTNATYYANKDSDAGLKAAEAKTAIKTLTDAVNTAINGLTRKYDVGYDNLFSLTDWAVSTYNVPSNGTVDVDAKEGTITIKHYGSAEGTDNNTGESAGDGWYKAPVEGDTEYVLTWTTSGSGRAQLHAFFVTGTEWTYNVNSNYTQDANWFVNNSDLPYSEVAGDHAVTFKTLPETDGIVFRFGTANSGDSVTFSNIRLVKKSAYDAYAKDYIRIREPFNVGDATSLMRPTREGYAFDGWEKADGTKIESVTGLNASETVYAAWTKLWTVTFLDGSQDSQIITTVQVKNDEAIGTLLPSVTPTKASDDTNSYKFDYWDGNGKKFDKNTVITGDITVIPVFESVPHTFEWSANPYKSATCDAPALVEKHCKDCGYSLGNVAYDGDNANWLAKGHDYSRGEILANSSTGNTDNDTHSIKCARYNTCGSVELVKHSWGGNVSEGATCTTPGSIKKTCPCGAEKFVAGETDSTAHNFDYTTGTPNGDKATHTVKCNYNNAHTEKVNCSDDDKNCECDICGQELIHVCNEKTKDFEASKADCYKDATYYYTCQCGKKGTETWTDEGSMLDHDWEDTETNLKSAADCENDEVYYKECSLCNVSSEGITDETWTKDNTKWNHKFDGDYVNNNNGTHDRKCTNAGCTATGATANCEYGAWTKDNADTHSHTCTLCSYTPEAEEHDWTDWTTVEGATNEAAAQHTRTCEVCYRVETESCKDSYKVTDRPETCIAPQLYTYTCEKCDHVYYVTGKDKTGHNYTGAVKSYNDGTHNFLCQNSCDTYGYEGQENAKTTCTYEYTNNKDGEHQVTCTACNYTFAENCSGGQATCTAPAVCAKCEEYYGTTVLHSFKGDAVKLDGDFHAYLCEFCGDTTKIYGVGTIESGKQDCSGGKATCSALAVCDVCKDTHGELDADEHKWGKWTNNSGTETHTRVCEYNNAHKEEGDCFSPDIEVVAPDCETAGYTLNTCEFCGHEWQTNPTDPLDHDWGAWKNNNDGTHTRTCKDETCKYGEDGGAKTETAECTKENAEPVVKAPTCTEGGYTTYTCKDCGYVWTDDATKATGHSYTKQTKKTDSKYLRTTKDCVTDWTYWYCCDNCDVSAETEVDKYENIEELYWVREEAVGHKYDAKKATEDYLAAAATCTTKATYYYSCSVCGASSEDTDDEETFEYGAVLGHDWVEPAEDKLADYLATPSDCITDATYYYVCNREGCGISSEGVKTDGETWIDVDSKSGHDFDYEGGYTAGVAANCTEAGVVEHYTCQTCGKHFNADKTKEIAADKLVIAALKHDYKDVAKKDATCEEDGYTKHKQCQREDCSYRNNEYEVIPATGHEFKAENGYYCDAVYGYHAYKCTNCDAYGVDGVKYSVDASGLDPEIVGGIKCEFTGEYVNYEADGIHSHKLICECGNEQSAACVDANPEHFESTCTESGYYKHICDVCSYEWIVASEAEEDKVLGHKLIVKSNGNGTHSVACEKGCGYAEKAEKCSTETPAVNCGEYDICDDCKTAFGEAKPHVFTKYESDNNATCTEDGTKTAICDTCTGEEKAKDTVADKGSKRGHDMSEYGYSTEGWTKIPEGFAEVIAEPTCHAEGKSISFCSRCDYYKIKTVKADPTLHVWEKDETSEDGLKWTTVGGNCATGVTLVNKCTADGCKATQSKTEAIPHDWKIVYIEEAGCTTHGYINFICNVCSFTGRLEGGETVFDGVDYSDKNIVAVGAHNWEKLDGVTNDYVALDGKIVYVDDNGNVVHVEKYPEYNAVGRGKMYCQKCNHIEEVTIAAIGNNAYDEEGNLVHKHPEFATINADGSITYKSTLKTVAKADPTCTVGGHEAYEECTRCSFSEYMIDHDEYYIEPTGHSDSNGDGKCDACKTTIREDASKNCSCICHKESGFMKFIYKIVNFFWKLFKMNPTCACGYKHY